MAIWDSICATYAVLGWVLYLSPQAAVAASRPPCAPCSQHPGPRSGMSAPGSSSSPSCSGCSASYCWVSGELEGGGSQWGGHVPAYPPPWLPQEPSACCSSSTWCSPASGPSPRSTWPGSSLTGTRRRKVGMGAAPPSSSFAEGWNLGSPLSLGPSQHGKWGAPCPTCSFPPLSHHHHGGKRDVAGLWGAFPMGPAAHWGGHHLLLSILALQVAGGCRACGNGPSGGTFGIISL